MDAVSRRAFLSGAAACSAAAVFSTVNPFSSRANPLDMPIGAQVWPLRAMLKDFPAFLKSMAELGVAELELCSPIGYGAEFAALADPKEVKKLLESHGLRARSSHFTISELKKDQERSIAWAKEIGITQMIVPTLGEGSPASSPALDQVKKVADEYNAIAAVAAKSGIQQGLHNEGFELAMVAGKRVYDLLFDLLDPKLVKFQFQMSTITAGLSGADYFLKHPGRFCSMHLQDIDMKAPITPSKTAKSGRRGGGRPQVALGEGSIDWVKTFTAAKTGGVENYFVEQTWELTRRSVAYLKTLKV